MEALAKFILRYLLSGSNYDREGKIILVKINNFKEWRWSKKTINTGINEGIYVKRSFVRSVISIYKPPIIVF